MNTGIIIFSRIGSSRLPGKALKKIVGRTLVDRVIDRVLQVDSESLVIVATTNSRLDNGLVKHIEQRGVLVFRGSSTDLLDRAISCANAFRLDQFVRISGDSPFIDPRLIEHALCKFFNNDVDLVTNVFPRTYPMGVSVEILKIKALRRVLEQVSDPYDREHLTSYFYKNAETFNILNFRSSEENLSEVNLAVDTMDDLKRTSWIIETFGEHVKLETAAEKSRLWRSS